MKIRLLHDLPIDSKHEAFEGNVYEAEAEHDRSKRPKWWIIGATGERIGVLAREAVVVRDEGE